MFNGIREFLKGYKTYIVAVIGVLTAVMQWADGVATIGEFIIAILVALGLMTIHSQVGRMIKGEKK